MCLAGGFEFLVSIGEDLAFLAESFGLWRHIADDAVKPNFVVILDVPGDDAASIFDRFNLFFANAVALDRAVITLDLAVALWVLREQPSSTLQLGLPKFFI